MTNPILHSLQPETRVEDRIANAFQGATIALAGLLALLTVAATV